MKILIAGGTKFIGRTLISFLVKKGNRVNILTRRTMTDWENIHYYQWNADQEFIDSRAFDGVDALINTAGANIGEKQWTVDHKKKILNSRVKPLDFLLKAMIESVNKIKFNIVSNERFIVNELFDKMLYALNRRRLYPNISEWVVDI